MHISTANHVDQRGEVAAARRRQQPSRPSRAADRELRGPARMRRDRAGGDRIPNLPRTLDVPTHQCHGDERECAHVPIDLRTAMVTAVAHELWHRYGGNEVLNWIEAEQIVDPFFQEDPMRAEHMTR